MESSVPLSCERARGDACSHRSGPGIDFRNAAAICRTPHEHSPGNADSTQRHRTGREPFRRTGCCAPWCSRVQRAPEGAPDDPYALRPESSGHGLAGHSVDRCVAARGLGRDSATPRGLRDWDRPGGRASRSSSGRAAAAAWDFQARRHMRDLRTTRSGRARAHFPSRLLDAARTQESPDMPSRVAVQDRAARIRSEPARERSSASPHGPGASRADAAGRGTLRRRP